MTINAKTISAETREGWATLEGHRARNKSQHFYPYNHKKSLCGLSSRPQYSNEELNFNNPFRPKCQHCLRLLPDYQNNKRIPGVDLEEKPTFKLTNKKLARPGKVIIISSEEKKLLPRKCDFPLCEETGLAFVYPNEPQSEKPHFCYKHDPKIQEALVS